MLFGRGGCHLDAPRNLLVGSFDPVIMMCRTRSLRPVTLARAPHSSRAVPARRPRSQRTLGGVALVLASLALAACGDGESAHELVGLSPERCAAGEHGADARRLGRRRAVRVQGPARRGARHLLRLHLVPRRVPHHARDVQVGAEAVGRRRLAGRPGDGHDRPGPRHRRGAHRATCRASCPMRTRCAPTTTQCSARRPTPSA